MNTSSRHFNSDFAHSSDFHCLTNFAKNINLSKWFLFGVSYYVRLAFNLHIIKSDQLIMSKIWAGNSFTFTLVQNSTLVTCKNTDNAGISELIPRKNCQKFLTLHSPFCLFLIFLKTKLPPLGVLSLESTSFDDTIICASKWFILTQRAQNLDLVDLSCVTYAQPIPLPLILNRIHSSEMSIYHVSSLPQLNNTIFTSFWSNLNKNTNKFTL